MWFVIDGLHGKLAFGWVDFLPLGLFVLSPLDVVVGELVVGGVLFGLFFSFVLAFEKLATGFVFMGAGDG